MPDELKHSPLPPPEQFIKKEDHLRSAAPQGPKNSGVVWAKGNRFLVEVASTMEEQTRGLMFRSALPANRAMLFFLESDGIRSIWMKNCLVSLDVVWLNRNGTVVEMAEHCPPALPGENFRCPSYGGAEISRHIVEFSSGTVKRIGLKKGDVLGWDLVLHDGQLTCGGLCAKGYCLRNALSINDYVSEAQKAAQVAELAQFELLLQDSDGDQFTKSAADRIRYDQVTIPVRPEPMAKRTGKYARRKTSGARRPAVQVKGNKKAILARQVGDVKQYEKLRTRHNHRISTDGAEEGEK